MRKSIPLAIGLLISGVTGASAVQLKDCSQGSAKKRIACLQANINTLNSSLEKIDSNPNLSDIVIQWAGHPNSCVTYIGNNTLQVRDTCSDPNENRFVIRKYQN
ncbi:hypothetical protein [Mesorhizobium erdmanii]|uniref:hypothetical protein n=1 Tax=Mesorhizobium erdmanii TaxID=1777866 RepID=UPI0012DAFD94|nr:MULTISPECIES: hypothetical protein [Mesorhizobium]